MCNLQLVPREELALIETHDNINLGMLSKKLLYQTAMGTVYVLDGHKLVGIVTLGDIRRYLRREKDDIINRTPKFLVRGGDEKKKISIFLKKYPTVHSIPIVDSKMNLQYAYVGIKPKIIEESLRISLFFEFLFRCGVKKIVSDSKDYIDWIQAGLNEGNVGYITCNYVDKESIFAGTDENCLVIFGNSSKDQEGSSSPMIMSWEKFDHLMFLPWVENWYSLMEKWCKNVSGYVREFAVISNSCSVFAMELAAYLQKYMPIHFVDSVDDIEESAYVLILDISEANIKEKENISVSYIESCIEECLLKYHMYHTLKTEIIPYWNNIGVHVITIEDPCNRELLPFCSGLRLRIPADAYELGERKGLEAVFGSDISNIIKGNEKITLMHGKASERIENHPIREELPTIFLFGPCIILGAYVKAEDTISSILQKKAGDGICVRNFGVPYWGRMLEQMKAVQYKKGDTVIFFKDRYFMDGEDILTVNIQAAYATGWQNNVWDNLLHCNAKIMNNIANIVYDKLLKWDILPVELWEESSPKSIAQLFEGSKDDSLENWFERVKDICKVDVNTRLGYNGAIVMNCNPFTLGHKYLIDKARLQVDRLYIFVVSENKSYFDYDVRYQMVKDGTQEFENVFVLPSGPYVISSDTMNGYFIKKDLQNEQPLKQYEKDVRIFGAVIAPKFGIKVRFVGEEPVDIYTNFYNKAMKKLLPNYGVEIVEVPRMCLEDKVISASEVRRLLKEKKYEELCKLVPQTTLKRLKGMYI